MQGQCPAKESLILVVDCFLDLTEWFWVGRGRFVIRFLYNFVAYFNLGLPSPRLVVHVVLNSGFYCFLFSLFRSLSAIKGGFSNDLAIVVILF